METLTGKTNPIQNHTAPGPADGKHGAHPGAVPSHQERPVPLALTAPLGESLNISYTFQGLLTKNQHIPNSLRLRSKDHVGTAELAQLHFPRTITLHN